MGFRFRKSIKIAPGVRLNFGKKSSSISFGGKGARYTVSSTGRKTASIGIPGTGISYTASSKSSNKRSKSTQRATKKPARSKINPAVIKTFVLIVAVVMFVHGLINIASSGWILMIIGAAVFWIALKRKKEEPKGTTRTNSVGEDIDSLTKDGELPFGWVVYNEKFVSESEQTIHEAWGEVYDTKDKKEKYHAFRKYFQTVNNVGEICKETGECHYKWFIEHIIKSQWYNEQIAEYKKLSEYMKSLYK